MSMMVSPYAFGSEIIGDGSVVGGTIDFTGLDLAAFYMIRVFLSGLEVNASDNSIGLQLEMGGSVVSSGYQYVAGAFTGASTTATGSASSAQINLHRDAASYGVGVAAGENLSGYFDVTNAVGTLDKYATGHMSYSRSSSTLVYTSVSGKLANTSNVTGFRIFCTDGGGSLTAGRAFIMGLG